MPESLPVSTPVFRNLGEDLTGSGRFSALIAAFSLLAGSIAMAVPESYVNSFGIRMVWIKSGAFQMGNDLATNPAGLKQSPVFETGGVDEKPVHPVTITYDFHISETEITAEQFNRFHEDHEDTSLFSPYASGMSWEDASGYCLWLSEVEGKNYRLPTEAEWEFVARAGSQGHFSSGEQPPANGEVNQWGVKNMHSGVAEWVDDWYDFYRDEPQIDPIGPAAGITRVVRGGGLNMPYHGGSDKYPNDGRFPFFRRSANRASLPPQLRGRHNVGFRIIEAPIPAAKPHTPIPRRFQQFVRQENPYVRMGPDLAKPWFRQRDLLPVPPESAGNEEIRIAGLHPSMHGKHHNPALAVAPNGDVIAMYFSASIPSYEDLTDVNIIATRLRFGAEEWDMPSPFFDIAGTKDIGPVVTKDGNRLLFAAGGGGLDGVVFRWRWSDDNGATWSPVQIPLLYGPRGPYFPQPVSNFHRGPDDTLYLPSDGFDGTTLLWASKDNGHTWFDLGGRTGGRHTVFAFLENGTIFGLGGKASEIDGYMPKSVSKDGGNTWKVSRTIFPALGPSGQKPALIRLASGRLFAAGDWLNYAGEQPSGMPAKTAWVALSDDEGESWQIKTLPGVRPDYRFEVTHYEHTGRSSRLEEGTLGYAMTAQGPNGVIHLASSKNYPAQHWEMNEAWILSPSDEYTEIGSESATGHLSTGESHPDGSLKSEWSGFREDSGRFVLDGTEIHHYPSGGREYEVTWTQGRKIGVESHWDPQGNLVWQWVHRTDRSKTWTHFWTNGQKRRESNWQGNRCHGIARAWDRKGRLKSTHEFREGIMEGK